MSRSITLVILFFAATLLAVQVTAKIPTAPTYFTEQCRSSRGNYTTNSTYEENIKSVLADLSNQSSTSSFYSTSAGSSSANQVFGQYYCRGDVSANLCHDCIKEAASVIFTNCSNFKGAVIWYEECTLRYQNISMVGVESEIPNAFQPSFANVTDPDKFSAVVNKTMARLINESAYGNSSFFATGEGVVSTFETAYCLVQCSPDLNATECDTCLHSAYDLLPPWWTQGVLVFLPSCQLRYSSQEAFYSTPTAPPPGTTSSPSPPPPTVDTASPPTGGSAMIRSGGSFLNLGIAILAFTFAFLRFW